MTEKNETNNHLIHEAEYFYQKIFSAPVPRSILEKYIAANREKMPRPDERIGKLVLKKADIEAVEMAWRFKSPRNVLTKKIHILIYLAETTPENFSLFFNTKNRRFFSFILLTAHFMRSVGKFIKGKFLLKRYNIV
jgi:hypothetical protein